MSDMWTAPEDDPRTYGNPVGEKATYQEYLDNYRLTIEMKCDGLDAEQLARRSVPPSTLSLLGLVRHLAQVENHWFQRVLQGRTDAPRLYKREDEPDWDFAGATPTPPSSRTPLPPGRPRSPRPTSGSRPSRRPTWAARCRWTMAPSLPGRLVHVIEEYARHAGHADLLRECLDGRTGQ